MSTDDRVFEAAQLAYNFASGDDLPASHHGLRAAVARALEIQREEIASAIEDTIGGYPGNGAERPKVEVGRHVNDAQWAARIARDYGEKG